MTKRFQSSWMRFYSSAFTDANSHRHGTVFLWRTPTTQTVLTCHFVCFPFILANSRLAPSVTFINCEIRLVTETLPFDFLREKKTRVVSRLHLESSDSSTCQRDERIENIRGTKDTRMGLAKRFPITAIRLSHLLLEFPVIKFAVSKRDRFRARVFFENLIASYESCLRARRVSPFARLDLVFLANKILFTLVVLSNSSKSFRSSISLPRIN